VRGNFLSLTKQPGGPSGLPGLLEALMWFNPGRAAPRKAAEGAQPHIFAGRTGLTMPDKAMWTHKVAVSATLGAQPEQECLPRVRLVLAIAYNHSYNV
jgi:hypothetical protein